MLTLDILMHGSLRECPRTEAGLTCPAELDGFEFQSTCGGAHLYAWGHDGRITCAYDAATRELVVTSLHPGVTREQVEANTGWAVRFAEPLEQTPPPTAAELSTLRDLQRRTAEAHAGSAA